MTERGWRTLWYNPGCEIAPDPVPAHDGELITLDTLDQVPALLAKPTLSQCYAWLDAWSVPENIRRHAELVAWMSYVLGVLLRGQGIQLDPILAHRGGLLHDLDKLHTLNPSLSHGEVGAAFLTEQGHPDLAQIVAGMCCAPGCSQIPNSPAGRPGWCFSAINWPKKTASFPLTFGCAL
jgi:hypothetical protein